MRLLLISNSGRPQFHHCRQAIREFVGPGATVGFVTAASLGDEQAYLSLIRRRLVEDGSVRSLLHVDWREDSTHVLDEVDAVFVGGGNTYALVERLGRSGLDEAIATRVRDGLPYMGSSAGANVAGPNILTTNDWNVVGATRFEGLSFVSWNVNPHYEAHAKEAATAETREDRISEYHAVRRNPVVALEEGALVEVLDDVATARGSARLRVFVAGESARWIEAGDALDQLPSAADGSTLELGATTLRQARS